MNIRGGDRAMDHYSSCGWDLNWPRSCSSRSEHQLQPASAIISSTLSSIRHPDTSRQQRWRCTASNRPALSAGLLTSASVGFRGSESLGTRRGQVKHQDWLRQSNQPFYDVSPVFHLFPLCPRGCTGLLACLRHANANALFSAQPIAFTEVQRWH